MATEQVDGRIAHSLVKTDDLESIQKAVESARLYFVPATNHQFHFRDYAYAQ